MPDIDALADLPRARPALKLEGSCLVRHIVLRDVGGWMALRAGGEAAREQDAVAGATSESPSNGEIGSTPPPPSESEKFREKINHSRNILARSLLQAATKAVEPKSSTPGPTPTFENIDFAEGETRVEKLSPYQGFRFRIRIDAHQEYMTITFIMDKKCDFLSANVESDLLERPPELESFWSELDNKIAEFLQKQKPANYADLLKRYPFSTEARKLDEENFKWSVMALFLLHVAEAGSTISDDLLDRIIVIQGLGIDYKGLTPKIFDPLKQDLYPSRESAKCKESLQRSGSFSLGPMRMESKATFPDVFEGLLRFACVNKKFFRNCLDDASTPGSSTSVEDWDDNSIFCGALGGMALYGSALGRRAKPEGNSVALGAHWRPIRYFVVYAGGSPGQFGRLVRLLHVLGEIRHAAIFDRHSIRKVGQMLHEMGHLWGKILPELPEQNARLQREGLSELNAKIEEIDKLFRAIGQEASFDLSYRLNRAEFYSDVFTKRSQDLRCIRIHPYQKYDEFMRRNVENEFDKIKSIAVRFKLAQDARKYMNDHRIGLQNEERQVRIGIVAKAAAAVASLGIISVLSDTVLSTVHGKGFGGDGLKIWLSHHGWAYRLIDGIIVLIFLAGIKIGISALIEYRKLERNK